MALTARKDPIYEAHRNRLIPSAVAMADAAMAGQEFTPHYAITWSRIYLIQMATMAEKQGLVIPGILNPNYTGEPQHV